MPLGGDCAGRLRLAVIVGVLAWLLAAAIFFAVMWVTGWSGY
jgi:hypothetical protein